MLMYFNNQKENDNNNNIECSRSPNNQWNIRIECLECDSSTSSVTHCNEICLLRACGMFSLIDYIYFANRVRKIERLEKEREN